MYLSCLKLWNFRKYGNGKDPFISESQLRSADLYISFSKGLNLLIGENDSGKTAIIDAIKIALRTHSLEWIRIEHDDFWNDSERLRIECFFSGFTDIEASHFVEWLGFDEVGKPYLRLIVDIQRKNDRILPYDVCAGVDCTGYRLSAEAREYLKTTYLKPLRDAQRELIPRKNSRLSQILISHAAFKDKDEHYLVEIFNRFKTEIEAYFRETKGDDSKGKELKEKLEEYLREFFGYDQKSTFSGIKKEMKDILDFLKLSLEDERMGLGSQNLLFVAAELLNLERVDWTGLRLGLIEELEAHLHPQAKMRVVEYLQKVSLSKESNVQWIITTHSPNLGSKASLKNLIICHTINVYHMGPEYTELQENDYSFLERFLDVTKANLFFAKGVILVEGWSEELILPIIAKKINVNLTQKGVSIVNVGSKAFLRYAKIFHRKQEPVMDIPVAVVTDLDIKHNDFSKGKRMAKVNQIESRYNKQKVKAFVSPYWTLEYCIARSPILRRFLIAAIEHAIDDGERGKKEELQSLSGDDSAVANNIYEYIRNHKISKTVVAQYFGKLLNESDITKKQLEADANIKYLLNAIEYVGK